MHKYTLTIFLLLNSVITTHSIAQEKDEKLNEGQFYSKLILAPEWEFCSIYGRSLSGALIMPNVDLSDATMIRIVKEIAKERKIKVNDQRVLAKKLRTGDSKCHFYAYLGSGASAPIRINKTVVGKITREQIVMDYGLYVYFDNDKLTAYQTSD